MSVDYTLEVDEELLAELREELERRTRNLAESGALNILLLSAHDHDRLRDMWTSWFFRAKMMEYRLELSSGIHGESISTLGGRLTTLDAVTGYLSKLELEVEDLKAKLDEVRGRREYP